MLDFDHLLVTWYWLKAGGPEFISVDTLRDFYQSPPPHLVDDSLEVLLQATSLSNGCSITVAIMGHWRSHIYIHIHGICSLPLSQTCMWHTLVNCVQYQVAEAELHIGQPDCEVGVLETDHSMRIKPTSNGPLINLVELSQHWCMPLANAPNLQVFLCKSGSPAWPHTFLSQDWVRWLLSLLLLHLFNVLLIFVPHPVYPDHSQFHHRVVCLSSVVVVFRSCKLSKPTFPSWRATLSFTRPAPPSIQVVK